MCMRKRHGKRCILCLLAALLVVSARGSVPVVAQTMYEIIEITDDGGGNVYVTDSMPASHLAAYQHEVRREGR